MTTMRWFRTGGPGRGAPAGRVSVRGKPWILALWAVAGMLMPGCAALGLGNGCGPCSGLRLPRLFNHRSAGDCCTPGEIPAGEVAVPGAVVTPGAVVPAPAPPAAIDELQAAPAAPAESGTGTRSNGSSTGSASKTNYNTYRLNRAGPVRGESLARALAPSEPARRPAQRRAAPPRAAAANSNNPLDNLPPLTLPVDPTSAETGSAVAPEARALPRPAEELSVKPSAARADGSQPAGAADAAQAKAAAPAGDVVPAVAQVPETITVVPGIRRFQGLEPKLAGGSLPSMTGLDWLADKGYKTILDLREPGDGQAAYITEASKRGLRYIALPISAATIDADHVNRFNAELDQADARPIYFFDTEGDRAGAMWYIRRLSVDKVKVDTKTASQEAKDLGLSDQTFVAAASAYLAHLATVKPAQDSATEATSASATVPPPAPQPPAPRPAGPAALEDSAATTAQANPAEPPHDPTAWRPYAALLVTGLGMPLAFWSRTSLFSLGAYVRASLPAPARSPRSLPAASGE